MPDFSMNQQDMEKNVPRETLFPVIRCALGLDSEACNLTEEELKGLLSFGNRQEILPIIWKGIQDLKISKLYWKTLNEVYARFIRRYVIRTDSIQKIFSALDHAGISYIPLKGAVLQGLYPEPWMRTSSDIDVLVHEEDMERAIKTLEEKTPFRFVKRNYHDVTMVSVDICLELHFCITENIAKIDALLEKVWDYAVKTDNGCCWGLTPEYLVFHILSHMSYHMVNGGLGIRPFLDLWMLKEKTDFDDGEVRRMCSECGILIFYEASFGLLNAWLNDGPRSEVIDKLEQYCLTGGVYGSKKNGAEQRKHKGLQFIVHRLFVSRKVLNNMYPELRNRPFLLPFYQIKRWTRLKRKGKRRGVIREIKRIMTTPRETIDSFDALLSNLGL